MKISMIMMKLIEPIYRVLVWAGELCMGEARRIAVISQSLLLFRCKSHVKEQNPIFYFNLLFLLFFLFVLCMTNRHLQRITIKSKRLPFFHFLAW